MAERFSGASMDIDRQRRIRLLAELSQLVEQRLCLDQVARVEALGEPAVYRGEEGARVGVLALIAPQAREARRGAHLEA